MEAQGANVFEREVRRVAQRNLGWSVEARSEVTAPQEAGEDSLVRKSQVFAVEEGDLAIADPTYEWAIDQVTDIANTEDIFQRKFGIKISFGTGFAADTAFTSGAGETRSTQAYHTVISLLRRSACSLNKVGLPLQTGVREADFGDAYTAQGEVIASCQIIIDARLTEMDLIKKHRSFEISASLFQGILAPHFSQTHRIGATTAVSRVSVQIKTQGVEIPAFLIRSDHFEEDIAALFGKVDRYFKAGGGHFHFSKAHLRPYTPSALKAKYQRLTQIIDEIREKLPTVITVAPIAQETWGIDLKERIARVSERLNPMEFYQSQASNQSEQVRQQDRLLENTAGGLASAVKSLIAGGFVSLNDYLRFQVDGAESLELTPVDDDRLAYATNNSKSFKIKPYPEIAVPGRRRFLIVSDEGCYLAKKIEQDATVRLTDVDANAAVWYLVRAVEGGYKLITETSGTRFTLSRPEVNQVVSFVDAESVQGVSQLT